MSLAAEKENTSFKEVKCSDEIHNMIPERWWNLARPLAYAWAALVI